MATAKNDEVVDVDALEFADDIEEIIISDYSGEEEDLDVEIVENPSLNASTSELKISSVISYSQLEFGNEIERKNPLELQVQNEHNNESESDLRIASVSGADDQFEDANSSEFNFSYDSSSDEMVNDNQVRANVERQRRSLLRTLYHNLWNSLSVKPKKQPCSKADLLATSFDMIKKLTVEGRKLEYSAELCMQSNYRLKRRVKKLMKKKRKQSVDSRITSNPGKVVTSRASI